MNGIEIIAIGDELLIGQTINTNAAWIGQQLALIGKKVTASVVISDDKTAIVDALNKALNRSKVVILTGGLGPTKDDITKKVLAEFFGGELVINEDVLKHVTDFFVKRNRPMLAVNEQQALVPNNCQVLFNEVGTAPGMLFERGDQIVVSFPGVPYEMKHLMESKFIPYIIDKLGAATLYHRTILTQGIGESFLAEELKEWENNLRKDDLELAYLPSPGMVKLRITSKKGDCDKELINRYIDEVKSRLNYAVYGEGDQSLGEVIGDIARNKKIQIGTIESCTGGSISAALTKVPGSSAYIQGGIVSYSNEMKINLVGVSETTIQRHGAVSKEVVEEMAKNGIQRINVDWCISVSGIAGPTGGSEEKPVGTIWIAIASKKTIKSWKMNFGGNRERNIEMTVLTALNRLRCELLGIHFEKKQN